jgi:hypothetical protein
MMSFDQQKALARLVHTIRGDWDVDGIMTALGDAREHGKAGDIRAICDAAVAAALDGRNRTPAIIPLAGPHWTRASTPPSPRKVDRQKTCGICSRYELECKAIRPRDHEFVSYADVVREALRARAARAARTRGEQGDQA